MLLRSGLHHLAPHVHFANALFALLVLLPCSTRIAFAQPPPAVRVTVLPETTGSFSEALSTSFQAAPWTDPAFLYHPEIPSLLTRLNPHHVNVQVLDRSIPETAPGVWNFAALDRQLQPILSAADGSPLVQLARAPTFLYRSKTRFVTPAFIAGYAAYCAGMVAHYNAPGSPHPIRFWGILNEPNYFGISPAEYVSLYNAAVPAMLAVDPTLKIVALELGGVAADERRYLPVFARDVEARVDILGVHFYATCDQSDPDQTLLDTIPAFVRQLHYMESQFPQTPIWITENNVNADFADPHGNSTCDPTHRFAEDLRGSSAFFAAWRAYEFSRFGQAGASALYHWVFSGDRQYGEYNTSSTRMGEAGHLQLGFAVDAALGRYSPSDVPGQALAVRNPASASVEVLAVRQPDGVTVLLANHAVANPADNNGRGLSLRVDLDLAALGNFDSATQLTIDASTDPHGEPPEMKMTPSPRIDLTLNGYGVTFLHLRKAINPPSAH